MYWPIAISNVCYTESVTNSSTCSVEHDAVSPFIGQNMKGNGVSIPYSENVNSITCICLEWIQGKNLYIRSLSITCTLIAHRGVSSLHVSIHNIDTTCVNLIRNKTDFHHVLLYLTNSASCTRVGKCYLWYFRGF